MTFTEFETRTTGNCAMRDEWILVGSGVRDPVLVSNAAEEAGLNPSMFTDRSAAAAMEYISAHRNDEEIDAINLSAAADVPPSFVMYAVEQLALTRVDGAAAARRIARRAKESALVRAMDAMRDTLALPSRRGTDIPALLRDITDAVEAMNGDGGTSLHIVGGRIAATREIPPMDTVLEGVFETKDKVDIVAPSKCRKSWFAIALALHLATGRDFLGLHVPKPRRVLYVNLEIKSDDFDRRLQRSLAAYGIPPDELGDRLGILPSRGLGPDVRAGIIGISRRFHAEVVVIDPQYKLLRPEEDENSGSGISEVLRLKDRLAEETGAAVIAILHDGKGISGDRDIRDRGAGSSWTARDFDARVTLTPHADDPDNMAVVSVMCRNHPPMPDFSIEFSDFAFRATSDAPVQETSRTKEERAREERRNRPDPRRDFMAAQIRLANGAAIRSRDLIARLSVQFGVGDRYARNLVSAFAKALPAGISMRRTPPQNELSFFSENTAGGAAPGGCP